MNEIVWVGIGMVVVCGFALWYLAFRIALESDE